MLITCLYAYIVQVFVVYLLYFLVAISLLLYYSLLLIWLAI